MSVASRAAPRSEEELDERLSEPRDATIDALRNAPGDIILLGAGGKMGPTLARMAARATAAADSPSSQRPRRVIAVSRFTSAALPRTLERHGVEALQCDLLDPDAVERLPDAPNVVFMGQGQSSALDLSVPLLNALPTSILSGILGNLGALGKGITAGHTGTRSRASSPSRPAMCIPSFRLRGAARAKTSSLRRWESTRRPVSDASASSSSTRRRAARASRSCGSITPSICAMAF